MSIEDICELGTYLQGEDHEKEYLEKKLLELESTLHTQDRRLQHEVEEFQDAKVFEAELLENAYNIDNNLEITSMEISRKAEDMNPDMCVENITKREASYTESVSGLVSVANSVQISIKELRERFESAQLLKKKDVKGQHANAEVKLMELQKSVEGEDNRQQEISLCIASTDGSISNRRTDIEAISVESARLISKCVENTTGILLSEDTVKRIRKTTEESLLLHEASRDAVELRTRQKQEGPLAQAHTDGIAIRAQLQEDNDAIELEKASKLVVEADLHHAEEKAQELLRDVQAVTAELEGPLSHAISAVQVQLAEVTKAIQYQAIREESFRRHSEEPGKAAATMCTEIAELQESLAAMKAQTETIREQISRRHPLSRAPSAAPIAPSELPSSVSSAQEGEPDGAAMTATSAVVAAKGCDAIEATDGVNVVPSMHTPVAADVTAATMDGTSIVEAPAVDGTCEPISVPSVPENEATVPAPVPDEVQVSSQVNKKPCSNSRALRGRRSKTSSTPSASDATATTAAPLADADTTNTAANSNTDADTNVSADVKVNDNDRTAATANTDASIAPAATAGSTVAPVEARYSEGDEELNALLAAFDESVVRKQAILSSIAAHMKHAEEQVARGASCRELGRNYDLQLQTLDKERESLMKENEDLTERLTVATAKLLECHKTFVDWQSSYSPRLPANAELVATETVATTHAEAIGATNDKSDNENSPEGRTATTTNVPVTSITATTTSTPPCSAEGEPPIAVDAAISTILQSLRTENMNLQTFIAQVRERMTSEVMPRREKAEAAAKEAKEKAQKVFEAKSLAYIKKEVASRVEKARRALLSEQEVRLKELEAELHREDGLFQTSVKAAEEAFIKTEGELLGIIQVATVEAAKITEDLAAGQAEKSLVQEELQGLLAKFKDVQEAAETCYEVHENGGAENSITGTQPSGAVNSASARLPDVSSSNAVVASVPSNVGGPSTMVAAEAVGAPPLKKTRRVIAPLPSPLKGNKDSQNGSSSPKKGDREDKLDPPHALEGQSGTGAGLLPTASVSLAVSVEDAPKGRVAPFTTYVNKDSTDQHAADCAYTPSTTASSPPNSTLKFADWSMAGSQADIGRRMSQQENDDHDDDDDDDDEDAEKGRGSSVNKCLGPSTARLASQFRAPKAVSGTGTATAPAPSSQQPRRAPLTEVPINVAPAPSVQKPSVTSKKHRVGRKGK